MLSKTTVRRRSGEEGPRHDPYGYEEWTFRRNGHVVQLHTGLINWVSYDGTRVFSGGDDTVSAASRRFEMLTGISLERLEWLYYEMRNRCSTCGYRRTRAVSGYPGETLNVCIRCGNVVCTSFHEQAVR